MKTAEPGFRQAGKVVFFDIFVFVRPVDSLTAPVEAAKMRFQWIQIEALKAGGSQRNKRSFAHNSFQTAWVNG